MARVADIKSAVARRFRIPPEDLAGRSRRAEHARPRQLAMTLACELTKHSASRIAFFFDRDHSTVFHARSAVAKRVEEDLEVRAVWLELRGKLAPPVEEMADG